MYQQKIYPSLSYVVQAKEEKTIPKVKTVVLNADMSNLGATSEDEGTFEYVAQEDMKIIGATMVREGATFSAVWATVSRSGNLHFAGEYLTANILTSDDQPLFCFMSANHSSAGFDNPGWKDQTQMLPSGDYFDLEEGERIYVQYKRKNNDASSHAIVVQVILFYK